MNIKTPKNCFYFLFLGSIMKDIPTTSTSIPNPIPTHHINHKLRHQANNDLIIRIYGESGEYKDKDRK